MSDVLNKRDLQALQTELLYRRARQDYYEYLRIANEGWIDTKLHRLIAKTVQDFINKPNPSPSFDVLLVSMPPQHGKLVSDDTPVLTTRGWVNHGDLRVGDYVFGLDGKPKKVTFVHPKYIADTLVTTKNGHTFKVHHNHEWVVHDRAKAGRPMIKIETHEMAKALHHGGTLGKRGHSYRYSLPKVAPLEGLDLVAPVDPYTLGLWLGDGTTTKPYITMSKDDMSEVLPHIKYDVHHIYVHKTTGALTVNFGHEMAEDFRRLGVMASGNDYGVRSKHIPAEYFLLPIEQRLELLAGLIDSDGYTYAENGRTVFSTCDKQLAEDVSTLVATFGIIATICTFAPKSRGRTIRDTKTVYQVGFNLDRPIPCKLRRKQVMVKAIYRRLAITKVEPLETPVQGNCITVEGGIYLIGRSLTPTHNSLSISETLPSWYIGLNPTHDVILISYNEDTASRFGRANRNKLERFTQSPYDVVKPLFYNYTPAEPWNNTDIANSRGKYVRSRGIMGGITGNPAHLIIIDDPIKTMEEARSETTKEKVWNEYYSSIRTRIKPRGKLIVIATRWVEDDLIGRLLETVPKERLTTLFIPAECVDEENDPLGRKLGDALVPEIGRDNRWLEEFKAEYIGEEGIYVWNALYQCNPTPVEGAIINPEWWKYYDYEELDKLPIGNIYISVDAAFKDTDKSDFVVIQTWGMVEDDYYLLSQTRDRLSFTDTLQAIEDAIEQYPNYTGILIEDKANGSAVIDSLQKDHDGIIPVTPSGGKESRLHAASKPIRKGKVHLPRGAIWLESYKNEFTSFPNGKHDDQVDSTTQVLNYLLYSRAEKPKTTPKIDATIKREWSEDMYEDYYNGTDEQKLKMLELWGYPLYGLDEEAYYE